MSEAKLTDIHFLVVFVFCKHPRGLDAPAESLLSNVYILTVFVFLKHPITHFIPSTHCQNRNGKCLPLSDNRQSKRYFLHR